MIAVPDAWAVNASSLPLAFAQVREDPRLDMELAAKLPDRAKVVMIASGGDTAVCLGRLPLDLHLVDVNPAQLALSQLKWQLARQGDHAETLELLGHRPATAENRGRKLAGILSNLRLPPDILGPVELVARVGPDHAGRYEITFAELRRTLLPWRAELDELLMSEKPVEDFASSPVGKAVDAAFSEVMSLGNLVCLFGRDATRNPRRSFSEHFSWRTSECLKRLPPRSNPFLWQILAGHFHPDHAHDWLAPESLNGRELTPDVEWHRAAMVDFLESLPPVGVDLVHLSNILDWLSPDEAWSTLEKTCRALKPGGKVIIRQLNSTLDIPEIHSGFHWDHETGRSMELRDRSFFYPEILIGSRA